MALIRFRLRWALRCVPRPRSVLKPTTAPCDQTCRWGAVLLGANSAVGQAVRVLPLSLSSSGDGSSHCYFPLTSTKFCVQPRRSREDKRGLAWTQSSLPRSWSAGCRITRPAADPVHHSYDAVMLIGTRINLLGTTGMPKCYLFILQSVRFTVKCYACPAAWSLAMVRDIAKQNVVLLV